jgi:putative ABC transport system permease protein
MTSRPPRLAQWIVGRLAGSPHTRDLLLGDLHEEWTAIVASRGGVRGAAWYWAEAAAVAGREARRVSGAAASSVAAFVRPAGDSPIRTFAAELRFAWRAIAREPLSAAIVVVTIGMGLGANAATLGWIDRLLLRPFPFDGVERLVVLSENSESDPFPQESVSPANFADFTARLTAVERLAAMTWWDVNASGGDAPERIQGTTVTGAFFDLVGAKPVAGRLLDASDAVTGRRTVVVSHAFWQRRFGAAPDVVGRVLRLDGEPYTIVGIAAAGFDFPNASDVWSGMALSPEESADRATHYLTAIGRLAPGRTLADARAEFSALYHQLKTDHAEATRGRVGIVRTFTEGMVDFGLPRILALWQAAAVLVLLIGCTNVANLLLSRGAARARELSVRAAIGASRSRLVRQLMMESLLIAWLAVPLALGVAAVASRLMQMAMPPQIVRFVAGWSSLGVDWRVACATIGAAVVASVLFGLIPALAASRPALAAALGDGGRSATGTMTRSRLRRGLVIAEIALALPLLVTAALAALAAGRLAGGPQGYETRDLVRARLVLPEATYRTPDARLAFADRLLAEAARLPAVRRVSAVNVLPATPSNPARALEVEGQAPDPGESLSADYRVVWPDYFSTVGQPIVAGRAFDGRESQTSQPVAIVSQSLAARFWPGGDAVGRRIRLGDATRPWLTIVGVANNVIHDWFAARQSMTAYVPAAQAPPSSITLAMKVDGDPWATADLVRRVVATIDPGQPVFEVSTQEEAIRVRTVGLRFIGWLLAVFGGLALALAGVGIYGVMAVFVTLRRHEMGVRMALGASRRDVLRLTLGHGARLAVIGLVLGLGASVALARLMEAALFGVVALEPWLAAATAGSLGLVALTASLVPARLATRVDPSVALRS